MEVKYFRPDNLREILLEYMEKEEKKYNHEQIYLEIRLDWFDCVNTLSKLVVILVKRPLVVGLENATFRI